MSDPHWIGVTTPDVRLKALSWGPVGAPIALCLHGFPDTAYGWHTVALRLVDAGWRVVAPFMRDYAPSTPSSYGSYHIGALMHDALRVLDAAGPTGRDVVIGHDWGAVAGAGLAAMPHCGAGGTRPTMPPREVAERTVYTGDTSALADVEEAFERGRS